MFEESVLFCGFGFGMLERAFSKQRVVFGGQGATHFIEFALLAVYAGV